MPFMINFVNIFSMIKLSLAPSVDQVLGAVRGGPRVTELQLIVSSGQPLLTALSLPEGWCCPTTATICGCLSIL